MALCALVFSALSPMLAAVALADRPAALAQMLGIPQAAGPAEHAGHDGSEHPAHASAHADHAVAASDTPPPDDGTSHRAHGIYCSLCLNASSTAAVLAAPPWLAIATVGPTAIVLEPPRPAAAASYPYFRSRAPPPPHELS